MQILKKEQPDLWRLKQKQGGITACTKKEMDAHVEKFIVQTFGQEVLGFEAVAEFGEYERMAMINTMMMIVFSHRYCKGDVFIAEATQETSGNAIDFTIVRDVMYKYSKKAQDRFFAHPIEAFFFAAFSLSDEGIQFLKSKPDNMGDANKLQRLQSDLSELKNQSVESLSNQSKMKKEPESVSLQISQSPLLGEFLFQQLHRLTKGKL